VFGGFPDSPEKSPELRGIQKYRTYDDLKYNLDIVATAVRRTLMLVKGATWRAQPPIGSGAEGERIAEAMTSILLAPRAMARPFPRVTSRQFMHIFDGSSIQVWTGKNRDDGLFGIQDIQPRPPGTIQRWDVDVDGTLNGVWQTSPWTGQQIPIPRKRMIYTADLDLSDSPEGTGILRHVAESARNLKRLIQIEGWGFETSLGGVPVVRIPYAALDKAVDDKKITSQQRDQYIKGAKSFIEQRVITPGRGLALESQHYVDKDGNLTPFEMFGIQLLSVTGGDQAALDKAIVRWLLAIARLFGIEGLFLGADSKGSFALSKDKTYMLVQIITSGLNDVAEALDADLVMPLMLYNGWDPKLAPNLLPSSIMLRDVEMIADVILKVAQAALPPDDKAINEIRDLIGVSPAPEDTMLADATLRPKQRKQARAR
jgi:hypothetical protein